MKLTESFQDQIKVFLSETQTAMPAEEIYRDFQQRGVLQDGFPIGKFLTLFQSHFFALVSLHWTLCCLNQHIDSKEIQNLFFKHILDFFATQKDLDAAAQFSEALYA